jgi:hypothetical protein
MDTRTRLRPLRARRDLRLGVEVLEDRNPPVALSNHAQALSAALAATLANQRHFPPPHVRYSFTDC